MTEFVCDVAIIGAGTAGLAAERAARSNGATTILIDEAFAGTTCTTVGCMPSKLLIAAAQAAHAARRGSQFGIRTTVDVDGVAVMKRLRAVRDQFVEGVKTEFGNLPEGVARRGRARFVARDRLLLDDGTTISAGTVVVATGATPSIPAFLDTVAFAILTNETLFDLEQLPGSVGVIGAGPLGLELAQALARLGVKVAVFDESGTLAGIEDADTAKSLHDSLSQEFPIHLGVQLSAKPSGKAAELIWSGKSNGTARFDHILAATGRPPRLDDLGLETTGLALDAHGAPKVDPTTMQCADSSIFLAGDAEHGRPVLHEAQAEGAIAGRNAASFPTVEPGERTVPLSIMFTEPAMAMIGEPPSDDRKTVIGMVDYTDQGRAKIFATNVGLGKIHADAAGGRLLFAQLVGPAVEHIAHLLAWAIEQKLDAAALLALPFYHPTYEEGLQPALREICKAVGTSPGRDRDGGFTPGG